MRNGLAHDVVLRNPRPLRAKSVYDCRRAPLHDDEQRGQKWSRQLRKRDVVLAWHDEHMSFEDRSGIEKRNDVSVVDDDMRRRATGDDRAEDAIAAGHGCYAATLWPTA
jgi:hypothetical protein